MDYYGNGNRSSLDKSNNLDAGRNFKGFKVSIQ